ncbi:hypothetical protein [Pseudohalocynthiibacter sp. F2068]|uniref:hypothetical protein n=1 Tax=Pseudohalocynthiibacter sp. F2068 TaxID=2926418 RepID=UPI001FF30AF4|nr:hypothetical protein [Pseudohalocynthiibacter sp. F2068]MCK0104391.1 hypothetical protein [Pseudohalocynthiibacter sp. F2068]
MIKLSGEASRILQGLSENEKKQIRSARKADGIALPAALMQMQHPSNADLIAVFYGMEKAGASPADYPAVIGEFDKKWKLGKRLPGDLRKVARHLWTERQHVKSLTISVGINISETGFDEHCEYTLKRLGQVHTPDKATLFRHGEEIAEVVQIAEAGTANIDVLTQDQFFRALSDNVAYKKQVNSDNTFRCAPPQDLVKYVYHSRNLPLPYLASLTRVPTMGEDYRINTTPGYNIAGHVYYAPPLDVSIPELPKIVSAENLAEARQILVREWLGDWPFDCWTRADLEKAALGGDVNNPPPPSLLNAIGFAMEQIVRPVIRGILPPMVFTKPTSRTGATLLVNAIQIAIAGEPASMTLETDDQSMEKKIVSHLKASTPVALLDNVSGAVDSGLLAKWWTDPIFAGRDLGKSKMLALPVTHSHGITTNNATFSRELANRLGMCRLDARMARPDNRTGFRQSNILDWTKANRGPILWALCVLAINWVQKGRPKPVTPTSWTGGPNKVPASIVWGGYEAYVDVIGGIVGSAAPNWTTWQANRHLIDAVAYSGEDDPVVELLTEWVNEANGVPKEILSKDLTNKNPKLTKMGLAGLAREHFISLPAPVKLDNTGISCSYTPSSIGIWLTKYRDRPFEIEGKEFVLARSEKRSEHGYLWKLEPLITAKQVDAPIANNVTSIRNEQNSTEIGAKIATKTDGLSEVVPRRKNIAN